MDMVLMDTDLKDTDQKSIDIPDKPDINSEHEEITLPSAESYRLFP